MRRKIVKGWLILVAPLLATSCEPTTCTLIGCYDGVDVVLAPAVTTTYDAELVLHGITGGFTCALSDGGWQFMDRRGSVPVQWCTGGGFLIEGTPSLVEVSVRAQDDSWTGAISAEPTYEAFQPNGPGCAPVCQVAELTVRPSSIGP